jgi:tetratricopeptide (TPR) repeat protein
MESDSGRPQKSSSVDTADPESTFRDLGEGDKTYGLLRQGKELLRAGRYQQAIHVWTRILFLDRGNPVAREAIEKAKRALAERQREQDALVAEAATQVQEGKRVKAKRLLARVLTKDPGHAEGRSLWEKIETSELRGEMQASAATLATDPVEERSRLRRRNGAQTTVVKAKHTRSASPLKMAAFLFCAFCLLALGSLYLHLSWEFLVSDSAFATSRQAGPETVPNYDRPQLPLPSDLHYYNGARLFAKGLYRDALSELKRVDRESDCFEEARSLTVRIEERLLRDSFNAKSQVSGSNLPANVR